MKKTYDILIGNKIWINKIGVVFGIIGSIITALLLLLIILELSNPSEMTVIFLIEFFENKIYLVLLTSILLFIIGMQIAEIRNYKSSELTIETEKISFLKNGELIEIPEPRLHKITERKKRFSKMKLIKIKTDTHKEYDIKGDKNILEHLTELFPNKTELKNVG